jgi:hypothetical protein
MGLPPPPSWPKTGASTGASGYTVNHLKYQESREAMQRLAYVTARGHVGAVKALLTYVNSKGKSEVIPVRLP